MSYIKEILPKMLYYRMVHAGWSRPAKLLNLTFSVTNLCQSKCKTCSIWQMYRQHPEKLRAELTLEEIERIFRSIGHVYVFNVSGGEPFLRKDFVEIIELACRHLSPGIIHIPTNAIATRLIAEKTRQILQILQSRYPSTRLTVKPSLDHIDSRHDEIRGVAGNFEKVMLLFKTLKAMKADYPHFHVELGTVISRWNVDDIEEIAAFITKLDPESYRNEIAEQRSEMLNMENPITPDADEYKKAIAFFVQQIKTNMKNDLFFHRITNAFRLVYYDLAIKILDQRRQVIPCYGGLSNAHLTPYGDIWACCTLGYDKPMGSLRDFGYDFARLWSSPQADEVRRFIHDRNCHCPMANQMYSNILMHPPSLAKVMYRLVVK